MTQLFLTDKEIRIIIDSLKYDNKELVHNILEQIFKKDLTKNEVEGILEE